MSDEFDVPETARKLFAGEATFLRGAVAFDSLPAMDKLEIAFAGRSNVGKSSLINTLTNRKQLARISHTPGRTQELNFFDINSIFTLVDMPGYGYAAAPEKKVKAWTRLIKQYLRGRATLARVYILIDARHGIKPVDIAILDMLDTCAVSFQIVLTKADQLTPDEITARREQTLAALAKRPAAFPTILTTSSRTGMGAEDVREAVTVLLQERGVLEFSPGR